MITLMKPAKTYVPALTPTEKSIFNALSTKAGKVLIRSEMQAQVWPDRRKVINPSTVDRHIRSLRRKLAGKAIINSFCRSGYIMVRWPAHHPTASSE